MNWEDEFKNREYRQGDEVQIRNLFRDTFGEERSLGRWKWQFIDNPKGHAWLAVAEKNQTLLGHHGIMRENLNFNGNEIEAGQECDAMVSPEARGSGVYTKLGKYNYARAAQLGLKAVFSLPSRNSFPGSYPLLIRKLGNRRIANLRYFFIRIGLRSVWGRYVDMIFKFAYSIMSYSIFRFKCLRQPEKITIDVSSKLPEDCDKTLKQVRDYEVLAVWKDRDYLKWRYENHPTYKYEFHTLRINGFAEAITVTRDCGDTLAICELFHRRRDVDQTEILLRHIIRHYCRSKIQKIIFYGLDNGYFEASFQSAGFHINQFSKFILTGCVFNQPDLQEYFFNPLNWTVVFGDADGI